MYYRRFVKLLEALSTISLCSILIKILDDDDCKSYRTFLLFNRGTRGSTIVEVESQIFWVNIFHDFNFLRKESTRVDTSN